MINFEYIDNKGFRTIKVRDGTTPSDLYSLFNLRKKYRVLRSTKNELSVPIVDGERIVVVPDINCNNRLCETHGNNK